MCFINWKLQDVRRINVFRVNYGEVGQNILYTTKKMPAPDLHRQYALTGPILFLLNTNKVLKQ